MAAKGRASLRPSAARVLLLSAVFIILSGELVEGRQCYWCGPLAEQVHRSPRAPPCDRAARHITLCEPGYDYCAVVATSPPYLESRFCVKMYQDECYPLFCNSTKTWKMTCPCRGDLCNGANTEREHDAFTGLAKLVSKTHSRITKRAPSRPLTGNRKTRIIHPEPSEDRTLANNTVEETTNTQTNQSADKEITLNNSDITVTSDTASQTNSSMTSINEVSEISPSAKAEQETSSTEATPTVKKELLNGDSFPRTSTAMIEIDIIQKTSNFDQSTHGAVDATPTVKKELLNGDSFPPTSTAMIEIDIIPKISNFDQSTHGAVDETVKPGVNLQADEPVELNDQIDVDNTKTESEMKIDETTTNTPKPHTDIITTTHSPTESTTMAGPGEQGKPSTEKPVEELAEERTQTTVNHMTSTIATTITTTPTVNKNQPSSKEKKNNTAIRFSVNIITIIECILLSVVI